MINGRFRRLTGAVVLGLLMLGLGQETAYPQPFVAGRAVIVVHLPPRGRLLIDGGATRQGGPVRTFITPPLPGPPGRRFSYTFVASWVEGGTPRSVERLVRFQAGQRVVVDL